MTDQTNLNLNVMLPQAVIRT